MSVDPIRTTRLALGLRTDPVLEALPQAGSDRRYWRVLLQDGSHCVASLHEGMRAENEQFAALARMLAARGIRVPAILADDPVHRMVWMEDLGDQNLGSVLRESPPVVAAAAYRAAVEEAARLHSLPMDAELTALSQPAFDAGLYQWEQDYFFEHFAGNHFGIDATIIASARAHPAMAELATRLADLPRTPIHRDFQSQNIIIQPNGRAALIDFQGLRAGLPEYDLASLFYDPYTNIDTALAGELFLHYHSCLGSDPVASKPILQACAIQRLMQALGAYGNLGYNQGKTHYLEFIPTALTRLQAVARGHDVESALSTVFEAALGN